MFLPFSLILFKSKKGNFVELIGIMQLESVIISNNCAACLLALLFVLFLFLRQLHSSFNSDTDTLKLQVKNTNIGLSILYLLIIPITIIKQLVYNKHSNHYESIPSDVHPP